MFFLLFIMSFTFYFFKFFNLRKLYFEFYLDFTKVQSYLDRKFRSFFFQNQLFIISQKIFFLRYFYFSTFQVPFFFSFNKFYFYTFLPNKSLALHSSVSPRHYFFYFFYFILFNNPKRNVYNFFGNYIFIFL